MQIPKQYAHIETDIKAIDQELIDLLSKADEPIRTSSLQLLNAGGKRTRPLMCILSSYFGTRNSEKTNKVAVALELIHMASLIHDDIIDGAPIRRGIPAIHIKSGDDYATFVSDYLHALAVEVLADIQDHRVHQAISVTIQKLVIGELDQLKNRYQLNQSIKKYLKKNRNKTARLIAVSCQLGAITSEATASIQNSFYWFGYYIGMSYQINDDILDFIEVDQKFGKLTGQDLAEGYLTLPSLLVLKDKKIYDRLHSKFQKLAKDQAVSFDELINDIRQTDAINHAYQYSQWYLDKALKIVKRLPDRIEKQILFQIVAYLNKRNY